MNDASFEGYNYLIFRLVMGFNMMIHGAVRVFGDYSGFIEKMNTMFADSVVPGFLVNIMANLISPVELIFGFLLILGFKTKVSILVLNFNMLILVSGVCLLQKWDLAGMQMAYVLYLFFLGANIKYNKLSMDQLLVKNNS